MLYDGSIIAKETNEISIVDSEETLMLEEVSRSKMLLKQSDPMVLEKKSNIKPINYPELNRLFKDFGKCFVSQQELSNEQAFRLQTSHPNTDQSASSPIKIEAPRKLPKGLKLRVVAKLLGVVAKDGDGDFDMLDLVDQLTPVEVDIEFSMFDARHELCFLEFVSDMNVSSKSKSVKKAKKKEEWKPTRKVEPIPLEVVAQEYVVTKVCTSRPKVKFLASKDKAPDFIIKFLKMIQIRLNAPVRNIRTDNGTEFINQTLRSYYESVGISHETSVA
nr:retrovirus-related Pol polyprotein from transposon TNT 1-94 [Tanacetum cinerariifolium]